MTRPLLLGHRGARLYAPENTIAAFDLCLEHGCDGFEFDVRRTSDARTVLCHDARIGGRVVSRNTFARLNMPSLEEAIERYASRAFLNIELKIAGVERATAASLRRFAPERGCVISSFQPAVVREMAARAPEFDIGLLAEYAFQLRRWESLPVSWVHPHWRLLSPRLVDELRHAGKRVLIWTVNTEKGMRRAAELGVDAIVSDDTLLLRDTLGR